VHPHEKEQGAKSLGDSIRKMKFFVTKRGCESEPLVCHVEAEAKLLCYTAAYQAKGATLADLQKATKTTRTNPPTTTTPTPTTKTTKPTKKTKTTKTKTTEPLPMTEAEKWVKTVEVSALHSHAARPTLTLVTRPMQRSAHTTSMQGSPLKTNSGQLSFTLRMAIPSFTCSGTFLVAISATRMVKV
jgi:hypothetical protein